MKHSKFVLMVLMVLHIGCTQSVLEQTGTGEGEVIIALSSDSHHEIISTKTGSNVPNIDEFEVEIYNSNKIRLYRDTYGNSVNKKIKLNGGDYRLLAQYGDSTAAGFDAIYYLADKNFTVHGQTSETISATARLGKTKVAVKYGEVLSSQYPIFYAEVKKAEDKSKKILFSKTETRSGYIPSGDLIVELYADINGTLKYFQSKPIATKPNDFITFNIEATAREGVVNLSVTIDNTIDVIEKSYEIPFILSEEDRPRITFNGFDAENKLEIIDGVSTVNNATSIDIVSLGGIKHCYLELGSALYTSGQNPGKIDLANLSTVNEELLESLGIKWLKKMNESRLAYIDFSEFVNKSSAIPFNSENPELASIKISIENKYGITSDSEVYNINMKPASFEINFSTTPTNIWATFVKGIAATITYGNRDKLVLEYSSDKSNWTSLSVQTANEKSITYRELSNLSPATKYYLRARYNNNDYYTTTPLEFITEPAPQIPNSGFENWTIEELDVEVIAASDRKQSFYFPYKSGTESWWATPSKKSYVDKIYSTTWTSVKCFPSVAPSTDKAEGSKSAHIYSVNIGKLNTNTAASGDTYKGEIFIGVVNNNGDKTSEGHSFNGRPSALTFKYKLDSKNDEKFYVYLKIVAENNTTLCEKTVTHGIQTDSWTQYKIDLDYINKSLSAGKIYLSFKSSSSDDPAVWTGVEREVNGVNLKGHFGNSLRIDDIKLEY